MANYINNKKFEELIYKFLDGDKSVEEELFASFDMLITKILSTFNFSLDFEDAKQECFVLILKVLKNFNKDNGKAFNYFTTVILNNCKLLFTKYKNYSNRLEEYRAAKTGFYGFSASSQGFEDSDIVL